MSWTPRGAGQTGLDMAKHFCVEYVFKPMEARVFPRSVNSVTVCAETAEEAIEKIKGGRRKYEFKILDVKEIVEEGREIH
jgi:hypothetical protein